MLYSGLPLYGDFTALSLNPFINKCFFFILILIYLRWQGTDERTITAFGIDKRGKRFFFNGQSHQPFNGQTPWTPARHGWCCRSIRRTRFVRQRTRPWRGTGVGLNGHCRELQGGVPQPCSCSRGPRSWWRVRWQRTASTWNWKYVFHRH